MIVFQKLFYMSKMFDIWDFNINIFGLFSSLSFQ